MFGSVEPSPAALVRAALKYSNPPESKSRATVWRLCFLVDPRRFELPTPAMRMRCAPNCATGPCCETNYIPVA